MGLFKKRAYIIGELCRLRKSLSPDDFNNGKAHYEGVRRGIKLAINAIEHMPKEWFYEKISVEGAYRIVLNDMKNSGCGLLVGKYDAENGDEKFMHGILTVMEWIAYKVGDSERDEFSDLFAKNIAESVANCHRIENIRF